MKLFRWLFGRKKPESKKVLEKIAIEKPFKKKGKRGRPAKKGKQWQR